MSAYTVDALRAEYGEFPVHEERFVVESDRLAEFRARARRDALGGARAVVTRDGAVLLVRNRGEGDWDAVGGAREPGETPEETVRREVREEVGLEVDLGPAVYANRLTFAGESGEESVTGVWPYFRASASTATLTVQESELLAARWFRDETPSEPVDRLGRPAIARAFDGPTSGDPAP